MTQKPTKYLNFNELRTKLGNRGRTSIYRDIDEGRLPKPMKFGARLYWAEREIDEIMNGLAEAA
ncbi:MAG: AlpA family phage regulatory protein [Pseudomonadota bacterium]